MYFYTPHQKIPNINHERKEKYSKSVFNETRSGHQREAWFWDSPPVREACSRMEYLSVWPSGFFRPRRPPGHNLMAPISRTTPGKDCSLSLTETQIGWNNPALSKVVFHPNLGPWKPPWPAFEQTRERSVQSDRQIRF